MLLDSRLPNFFIIGAAKSGSTTLHDLLAQHPKVYFPYTKEPKFFNNDINYSKGMDWYIHKFFQNAEKYTARGEATPHYLYWGEKVAERILVTYNDPAPHFIAIFRDPVARAYSQYWMDVQREIENLSFAEALQAENQRLLIHREVLEREGLLKFAYYHNGCYATLLRPYLDRFPRERFHFLILDDLKTDLQGSMTGLAKFLGINCNFLFKEVSSNSSWSSRNHRLQHYLTYPSGAVYHLLKKLFLVIPERSRYQLRSRVISSNKKQVCHAPVPPEVELDLRKRYQHEIFELEKILDRDLSAWYRNNER